LEQFDDERRAKAITDAWYALANYRSEDSAVFEQTAKAFREAPVKPSLPEAARRYKVQAEAAIKNNNFFDAVDGYEQALEVVPWWPEGRFNMALILGELKAYKYAIRQMTKYLALVPNAPDARAAQDKIYEWEAKVKK
jgi:tetratricopeptide (TPR) repeat protein